MGRSPSGADRPRRASSRITVRDWPAAVWIWLWSETTLLQGTGPTMWSFLPGSCGAPTTPVACIVSMPLDTAMIDPEE